MRADVDQAFLARVAVGKSGYFEHNGEEYDLIVSKIYPEIDEGRFAVDFDFKGDVPGDLRRGLSLYIKLEEGNRIGGTSPAAGGILQPDGRKLDLRRGSLGGICREKGLSGWASRIRNISP